MTRLVVASMGLLLVLSVLTMACGLGAFSALKNGIGRWRLATGGAFVAVADDAVRIPEEASGATFVLSDELSLGACLARTRSRRNQLFLVSLSG